MRLATGWTVRGSNSSKGDVFRTLPDWPRGPPSLQYTGQQVYFPGVKQPGCGIENPPLSAAEVEYGWRYMYLYLPLVPAW